jgi:uncharacterized protein YdeI (YjbR/CyaY-like superfamily)
MSMQPRFFATPEKFRGWLEKHHATATELWVGFHRKGSGRPSVTWPESVDEALCYGWIDGIRKSVDEDSYMIRFTPRRKGSVWSAVNLRRARELIEAGRMQTPGLAAFEQKDLKKSARYSFEQKNVVLDSAYQEKIRKNRKAWAFFEAQPPYYRKQVTWWIMSAKREETRLRRLRTLITDSAAGRRIGLMRRPGEKE